MSSVLEFGIRVSVGVKSVHLVGSWDNYAAKLPLINSHERPDAWRGTFKFASAILTPGQRYWYYYIIDAQHALHDPSKMSTVEPTTGQTLNILDVPVYAGAVRGRASQVTAPQIAVGRPVSPAKIVSPKPFKPQVNEWMHQMETGHVQGSAVFVNRPTSASSATTIADSEVPSLSSSPMSAGCRTTISSSSEFFCTCELYGVTASGHRVLLSCGGRVCGSDDDSSCCDSEDDDEISTPLSTGPPQLPRLKIAGGAPFAVQDLSPMPSNNSPNHFVGGSYVQSKSPLYYSAPRLPHQQYRLPVRQ